MLLRTGNPSERLSRGVWVEAYMGEQGEIVLVAVRANGRRLCPEVTIRPGEDSAAIAEALWDRLEAEDPDRRSIMRVV
jgi:hypothetical protein